MNPEENISRQTNIDGDIDTGGGMVNTGTVNTQGGDVAGRDLIQQQVVIQRLNPANTRNQRNHAVLRQAVRRFWIDGVLKSSLYNEMLIRLGLESNPDAVDNRPWDLILQQPNQPDHTIILEKRVWKK